MRYLCIAALLLALPVAAPAQQQRRGDERRSGDRGSQQRDHRDERRSERETHQSTQRAPWWERQQAPWWEQQQTPAWQTMNPARTLLDRERNQRPYYNTSPRRYYPPSVVYVVPPYRYFPDSLPTTTQFVAPAPAPQQHVAAAPPAPPVPPPPPMGGLHLDVEPKASLQVFVDGVFVGTPADLGDQLELTAGRHRLELRARGYRTLTFDVEIIQDRSITYRGALDRDPSAPPPPPAAPVAVSPAAPVKRTTMFMIPGCYLGNVEPKAADLKPGCEIRRMMTILP